MNDLPESMQEDPIGACRGIFNGCLGVIGLLVLIAVVVFLVTHPGF